MALVPREQSKNMRMANLTAKHKTRFQHLSFKTQFRAKTRCTESYLLDTFPANVQHLSHLSQAMLECPISEPITLTHHLIHFLTLVLFKSIYHFILHIFLLLLQLLHTVHLVGLCYHYLPDYCHCYYYFYYYCYYCD